MSDSRKSKFCWNLSGDSIEISDFGADVNNRVPLNYGILTRQVQLGRSTTSGGITSEILKMFENKEIKFRT